MLMQCRRLGGGQQQLQSPGRQAGDSEQPEATRGLWLTDGLEHMVDTLLGTSRLVWGGELCRESHSFI